MVGVSRLVLVSWYQSIKKPESINRKAVSKKKKKELFYRFIMIKKGAKGFINIGKDL